MIKFLLRKHHLIYNHYKGQETGSNTAGIRNIEQRLCLYIPQEVVLFRDMAYSSSGVRSGKMTIDIMLYHKKKGNYQKLLQSCQKYLIINLKRLALTIYMIV